jgi:hypothetical protein
MTETAPDLNAAAALAARLTRIYPVRQPVCKDPARAEAKRIAAKAERQRRRRAQKRMR